MQRSFFVGSDISRTAYILPTLLATKLSPLEEVTVPEGSQAKMSALKLSVSVPVCTARMPARIVTRAKVTLRGAVKLSQTRQTQYAVLGGRQVGATRRSTVMMATGLPPAISLTETAQKQLLKLSAESEQEGKTDLCLRVGVRQGGCSGMSYTMDLEERSKIEESDSVIDDEKNGFTIVCDPKSLLYLFGLQLDYSDALIGGGFQFNNPNAEESCGCGKSFSA